MVYDLFLPLFNIYITNLLITKYHQRQNSA
nr:MAG TPA: hypothetical protein [Caudoviricetes sp.]